MERKRDAGGQAARLIGGKIKLGLFAVNSMHNLDYEPIIGVVFLSALFYALAYFVADLVTFAVDPRIRAR